MLTLIRRIDAPGAAAIATLSLTAGDRLKSRHRFTTAAGQELYVNLPRGTMLRGGDWLESEDGQLVEVIAQPQPVLTVTTSHPTDLMRAAYHLGNRHVPVEITPTYLRLEPDPVLKTMLEQLGLIVTAETAPFEPEAGAYGGHSHG